MRKNIPGGGAGAGVWLFFSFRENPLVAVSSPVSPAQPLMLSQLLLVPDHC